MASEDEVSNIEAEGEITATVPATAPIDPDPASVNPTPTEEGTLVPSQAPTADPALLEELTTLRIAYQSLQTQNDALHNEIQCLNAKLDEAQAEVQAAAVQAQQQQEQHQQQERQEQQQSSVATAAAAAQLDNYQQALNMVEAQKQQILAEKNQVDAENDLLKNKLAQLGITLVTEGDGTGGGASEHQHHEMNDNPVGENAASAATNDGQGGGDEMVVAIDPTNDPTAAAANMATMSVNIMGTATAVAAAAASEQHQGVGLGVAMGNVNVNGEEEQVQVSNVTVAATNTNGDVVNSGTVVAVAAMDHHQHQHQHHHAGQLDISAAEAEALAAVDSAVQHNVHQQQQQQEQQQHIHHHHQLSHDHNVTAANLLNSPTATTGLSSRSDEKWEQHFQRLVEYKNNNGNCLVPTSTELGRWLCRQRHNHRYKGLKEDRKMRLIELDATCLGERLGDLNNNAHNSNTFIQHSNQQQEHEHHMQQDANMVVDGNGNVNDPTNNCILQQNQSPIPPVQSKTKYNLAYESKLHAKWDNYFQKLVAYKNEHGHSNFPTMNGSVGRWISRQRTLYRNQKLKADRYEKLKSIGFAFEDATALEFKGKLDMQWDNMFAQLNEHRNRMGHCFDVPENMPLGKWLYRQRWLYRHGNLREDRAKRLLDIGFEDKKVLKKDSERKRKRKRDSNDSDLGLNVSVDAINEAVMVHQEQSAQDHNQSMPAPAAETAEEEKREGQDSISYHQIMEETITNESTKATEENKTLSV